MREYIAFRSDLWLRPCSPHIYVDNRYGSAIALTDQTRFALGAAHA